jgi:hypothetical protein
VWLRYNYPGVPDDEAVVRNVIEYALGRVTDPDQGKALRRRLEGELRGLLARPDGPSGGAAPTWVRVE